MRLIGFCMYHNLALLTKIFLLLFFSDRFRTAINVFGDSIGCAIVQHLSRKELDALDANANNPTTGLRLLVADVERDANTSNHVVTTTYDNPVFLNQSETFNHNKNIFIDGTDL